MNELMTVTEAAEEAGVAASTIYRWIQGGVLSLRYFNDGRQAIFRDELAKLANSGENIALIQLFLQVGEALGRAVALLPSVEHKFGPGWKDHACPAREWERIRVMAYKQAEAHRDIAPFMPRRGRPSSAMERFRTTRKTASSRIPPT